MIRVRFPPKVVRQIERRASSIHGVHHCEQCGADCLNRSEYEIDHCTAEATRVGERFPLTARDGQLLCLKCHEAKTKEDVSAIARAKRLERKHFVVGHGEPEIARRYKQN